MKIRFALLLLAATLVFPAASRAQSTLVRLETTHGTSVIRLFDDTPRHRDNFVRLVQEGRLDSTLFFRVIPFFVVQGGDPDTKPGTLSEMQGEGDLGYRIPAEIHRRHLHVRGAVGAAREADDVNPRKESSASQFYVVTGKAYTEGMLYDLASHLGRTFTESQVAAYTTQSGLPQLDGDYTVFGEVVDGMDVWDAISDEECDESDHPLTPVVLLKAFVVTNY